MDLSQGVGIGQVVDPNHILRIIHALTGQTSTDIIIKGNISGNGLSITGSSIIAGDLNISQAITASKLSITQDYAKIGNNFNILNNSILIGGTTFKDNNVNITGNLIITGSVILPSLPQNSSTKTFLSLSNDQSITYTTGSLKDYEIEKFKFASKDDAKDIISFRGIIKDISITNTFSIKEIQVYSKLDIGPTWIEHKDINSLQEWIDKNIKGDELEGDIFWIKINPTYKDFISGRADSILKFSR